MKTTTIALPLFLILFVAMIATAQAKKSTKPRKIPASLSGKMVRTGEALFERNIWKIDQIEIHNFLGKKSCSSCHDGEVKLTSVSLAKNFKRLKPTINKMIVTEMKGKPLPLEDPAMESLVQYIIYKYRLTEYKLYK